MVNLNVFSRLHLVKLHVVEKYDLLTKRKNVYRHDVNGRRTNDRCHFFHIVSPIHINARHVFSYHSTTAKHSSIEQLLFYHKCNENRQDRKSTRLNSSHVAISYAVFCL